jgi:hypothetical protein
MPNFEKFTSNAGGEINYAAEQGCLGCLGGFAGVDV